MARTQFRTPSPASTVIRVSLAEWQRRPLSWLVLDCLRFCRILPPPHGDRGLEELTTWSPTAPEKRPPSPPRGPHAPVQILVKRRYNRGPLGPAHWEIPLPPRVGPTAACRAPHHTHDTSALAGTVSRPAGRTPARTGSGRRWAHPSLLRVPEGAASLDRRPPPACPCFLQAHARHARPRIVVQRGARDGDCGPRARVSLRHRRGAHSTWTVRGGSGGGGGGAWDRKYTHRDHRPPR